MRTSLRFTYQPLQSHYLHLCLNLNNWWMAQKRHWEPDSHQQEVIPLNSTKCSSCQLMPEYTRKTFPLTPTPCQWVEFRYASQSEHSVGGESAVTFRLRQRNLSDRHLVTHTAVIRVTFLPDAHTHNMLSPSLTPVQWLTGFHSGDMPAIITWLLHN